MRVQIQMRHLEYLVAVVDEGGFSAAAKKLGVSPQTLSDAIRCLGDELGLVLFERAGRGVMPTQSACDMAREAKKVLSSYAEFLLFAQSYDPVRSGVRKLRVGITASFFRGDLLGFHTHQWVVSLDSVEVFHVSLPSCLSMLKAGVVDCAIAPGSPSPDLFESLFISTLPFSLVLLIDKARRGANAFPIEDLGSFRLAMPYDFHEDVFSLLVGDSELESKDLRFASVEPTLDAHTEFIQEGGAVVVVGSTRSLDLLDNETVLPLTSNGRMVEVPCSVLFRRGTPLEKSIREFHEKLVSVVDRERLESLRELSGNS